MLRSSSLGRLLLLKYETLSSSILKKKIEDVSLLEDGDLLLAEIVRVNLRPVEILRRKTLTDCTSLPDKKVLMAFTVLKP